MWDFIKKAGRVALERGADYLAHYTAISSILKVPDFDTGVARLRVHVMGIETDTSFQTFLAAVRTRRQEAMNTVKTIRQQEANGWGNSVEDRMAKSMAELRAGLSGRKSREVLEAERMVEIFDAMERYAQQFWEEKAKSAARVPEALAPQSPLTPDEGRSRYADYVRELSEGSSAPFLPHLAAGPMDEIEAAQLHREADRAMVSALARTNLTTVDDSLLNELDRLHGIYAKILDHLPINSTLVTEENLQQQMALTREWSGNVCEKLNRTNDAIAFFEDARALRAQLGQTTYVERLTRKIAVVQEHVSGDTDQSITRLSAPKSDPMEEINRLLDLAAVYQTQEPERTLELLAEVEGLIDKHGFREPSAQDMAKAFASTMAGVSSDTANLDTAQILNAVALRGVFQSLYTLYYRVYLASDPTSPTYEEDLAKAKFYSAKVEKMGSRKESEAFGQVAKNMLGLNGP
ncbi:MAG: hypothetical protein AAF943_09115 [Pseudomonadota bacterium]